MAISLNNIIKINPGVLSATGSALDLNGLILTDSEYAPKGALLSFTNSDDVSTYFGSASTEFSMADIYFQGFNNASQTPGQLFFCRYNSDAIGAFLRSATLGAMTLAELKLLSGTLTLTINGTSITTANISLSSAASFADAATQIEDAINAINSGIQVTVVWDTTTKAFIITTATTGDAATLTFSSGTLAPSLLLTSATGATLSQGADADVVSELMTSVTALTQDWAQFTTTFVPTADQVTAFASWVSGESYRYVFVLLDDSNYCLQSGSTQTLFYPVKTANYAGVFPVYGDVSKTSSALGYGASLNFNQQNGRLPIAFRVLNGLLADVTTNSDYSALITNGYSFYGTYGANNYTQNMWYNGAISGDYKWLDAQLGQIWLNANLQKAILTLFTSNTYIPYNAQGKALIEGCMTATIEQFKTWGGCSVGTDLDASQILAIKNIVGSDISSSLISAGYYIYVAPFNAAMRANRTTPTVYLWYCDGGVIQKLTVNSVEVQ